MKSTSSKLLFALIAITGIGSWEAVSYVGGSTVTCYVCSWSSPQTVFNETHIPDVCTANHFVAQAAHTVSCSTGCETVALRESRNGRLIHFHRNCMPDSGRLEDRCRDVDERFMFETRCSCLSNYCNESPSIKACSASLGILPAFFTLNKIIMPHLT